MGGALDKLRILDFSQVLAGPFATMLLADLGAEVLKVERPGHGDETRRWLPPLDVHGQATYFDAVNRNKRSIALDLRDGHDLDVARRLAADADVLIENFRPGVLDGFGLGYEELSARTPRLVYCTITGFGRSGEGAKLPGYDLLVQAVGGLMSITGEPDGAPQRTGVAVVDVLTGLFATVGILAALRHRDATGQGQRIDVDLMSSLLAALVNQSTAYTAGGVVPGRIGNTHPSIVPYQLLPTADGHLLLAVGNDRQFRALCDVLDASELADDERYATNPDRVTNRSELTVALEALLATRRARDWATMLTAARVPAGEVNDIAGAFELAERLGLEPTIELDGVRLPRNPIRLSETPATYRIAPPALPERSPSIRWSRAITTLDPRDPDSELESVD